MKKRDQIEKQRAVQQFRRLATEQNPNVQMVLPMADIVGLLQQGVGHLLRQAGLELMNLVMDEEVHHLAGERIQTTVDLNRREQDRRLPLPGTLLTREWKGRTIVVEVSAKGFRYENRQYSSLSAIAVAITGTRWNGVAFFGLTRPARKDHKEQPRAKK